MDQATSLATSGYLCNDTVEIATFGYILSYSVITPTPDTPIMDDEGNYYTYGSGGGGGGKQRKSYVIKITFTYKGEVIEQIRAFNPNLEISVENLQIEVINNKPVVTLKEFVKKQSLLPTVALENFEKLGKNG